MRWRIATAKDSKLRAEMNRQLIADEGHRNPMSADELELRIHRWLTSSEYQAVLFEQRGSAVAYALFRENKTGRTHLRQFFVARPLRRRGLGREAFELFRNEVVPT